MSSFLFPFYVDELTTVLVRLKDDENLTKPHRRHYYQLLANEKGMAHGKVSVGYGVFQLAVGGSVLMVRPYGLGVVFLLLAGWVLAFWIVSSRLRGEVKAGKDEARKFGNEGDKWGLSLFGAAAIPMNGVP
jgi:hypothetical protein